MSINIGFIWVDTCFIFLDVQTFFYKKRKIAQISPPLLWTKKCLRQRHLFVDPFTA